MTISNEMGLGFGSLLAPMAALAIVVLFHLANISRQSSLVIRHDVPVIASAGHPSKLVVETKTGQRGFVIAGKDEFLEPHREALASLRCLLREEALVNDYPTQAKLREETHA